MKKFIPYILLALIIFLAGRWTKEDNSKELEAKYKAERKLILDVLGKKQIEVARLQADSEAIRKEMVQDSLRFAGALERNQTAYNRLKKKYNEINLHRADAQSLDSLVSRLYPARLYPDR